MRSSDFYDLVSGRKRGVGPMLARAGLSVAELPYGVGVWWRNRRYDRQDELVTRVDAPVLSVGNLTLGGTGKTPIVKWLARYYREKQLRVAIVSRGYGAEAGAKNDEALELEQSLPDVPHIQNPDRVAAAQTAIEELGAELILMDDGFQHRRLGRDLDFVLIDATEPFGYERLFPRGALREPIGSLRRAQVVCLSRADRADSATRQAIRERVQSIAPNAHWCESVAQPSRLITAGENAFDPLPEAPLESLSHMKVSAFCGLGNPIAFRATVESLGAELNAFQEFPDHHAYTREDIESLASMAADCDALVCTHKDLVKIGAPEIGGKPLWAIEIEAQITGGAERLSQRLDALGEDASARSAV